MAAMRIKGTIFPNDINGFEPTPRYFKTFRQAIIAADNINERMGLNTFIAVNNKGTYRVYIS